LFSFSHLFSSYNRKREGKITRERGWGQSPRKGRNKKDGNIKERSEETVK